MPVNRLSLLLINPICRSMSLFIVWPLNFDLDTLTLGSFLVSCEQSMRKSRKPRPLVLVPNGILIYHIYVHVTYFDFSVVRPHLWLVRWILPIGPILQWVTTSPLHLLNPLLASVPMTMLIRMSIV